MRIFNLTPNFYCDEAGTGGGAAAPAATPSAPAAPAASTPSVKPTPTTAAERAFESFDEGLYSGGGAKSAPATTDPNAGTPAVEGGAQPAAVPQPTSTQTPQVPGNDRAAQLEADLRARDAIIANLTSAQQARADQGQPPAAQTADDIPDHMYTVPAQVLSALRSEDPNEVGQGMSQLISMTIRTAHRAMRQELNAALDALRNEQLPSMLNAHQQHQAQSRTIYEDFYGTYKDLNDPALYPLVTSIAMQNFKAGKFREWSPQAKTLIANEVYRVLGRTPGGATAAPAGNPAPAQLLGGNNSRPEIQVPKTSDALANEVMDLWR